MKKKQLLQYHQIHPGAIARIALLTMVMAVLFFNKAAVSKEFVTELRSSGYSLVPSPQKVELKGGDIIIDDSWRVVSPAGENIAAQRLRDGAQEFFNLAFNGDGTGEIILNVDRKIKIGTGDEKCRQQAYELRIEPNKVSITGYSDQGLFYGVQSVLQLLKPDARGNLQLPIGIITDWPELELRFIHWDTKHHQDRVETLKRYIDWAAFFKINAIGFETEDKYEYPRHPIIGAPGAFTKEQMQELTAYALERYIQLVPQVQAPAHMAYVLKHEEFAHLRSDGSNYQICMCDEEAIELIQDMYQDMIDATPGVEYFFVSTDEVYYAGICEKCDLPYNAANRSKLWVDYVNRMHDWLAERGRRMLCWVEYPLLDEDIPKLPKGLIDAIMTMKKSKLFVTNSHKAGLRHLAYSSIQGAELLFPNYFPVVYNGKQLAGRLKDASQAVTKLNFMKDDLLGTYAAAWDDAGLHNETFWLGWVTVTQYGWTPEWPTLEQNMADFMDVFYGAGGEAMVENYKLLMEGARFFEASWEIEAATDLPPRYGNPLGKGIGTNRTNYIIEPPYLPVSVDKFIHVEQSFTKKYKDVLEQAPLMQARNDQLLNSLYQNLAKVQRNRYNLEVLISIASLERHFIDMMLALEKAEENLASASEAAAAAERDRAAKFMINAHNIVKDILRDRADMWERLTNVWNKSRYPKGQSVDGRHFVHILDNVKDHFADRRTGLDYMLAPFERIGLEQWCTDLAAIIKKYAANYNVPAEGLKE